MKGSLIIVAKIQLVDLFTGKIFLLNPLAYFCTPC
jgi:hypothetical protein